MSDPPTEEDVLDRGEIEQAFHRADETTDADAWLERNIDPLLARIEALEAEREGLREALGGIHNWVRDYLRIESEDPTSLTGAEQDCADVARCARQTLKESE